MPRVWQPLKLSGTPEKGQVIVGDAACAIFFVTWERPKRPPADLERWVRERLRRHGVLPEANPPAAGRFSACGWAHGVQTEEGKETTWWYGYAAPARLCLGIVVNGVLPRRERERVARVVLPSLRTTAADAATTWSLYDVSFVSPPGFELAQRHLFSGDVALEFVRGRQESLLLRQVYPADLALARQTYEQWLARYPFKEHRRLRQRGLRVESWQHTVRHELSGVERRGRKCLKSPMGWCAPRWTAALAVTDAELNRLLVAEHMAARGANPTLCADAILRMNGRAA